MSETEDTKHAPIHSYHTGPVVWRASIRTRLALARAVGRFVLPLSGHGRGNLKRLLALCMSRAFRPLSVHLACSELRFLPGLFNVGHLAAARLVDNFHVFEELQNSKVCDRVGSGYAIRAACLGGKQTVGELDVRMAVGANLGERQHWVLCGV